MATDNFDTNADPIGAPWVTGQGALAALRVVTNQLALTAGAGANGGGYYSGAASTPDQYAECTIVISDSECGPAVRVSPTTADMYWLDAVGGGNLDLYRIIQNSTTEDDISTTTVGGSNPIGSWVAGDVLRLEISGSTLTIRKNGALVTTRTDGTLTTGQPGAFIFGEPPRLDNWSGGDLAVPPPVYTYPRWRKV